MNPSNESTQVYNFNEEEKGNENNENNENENEKDKIKNEEEKVALSQNRYEIIELYNNRIKKCCLAKYKNVLFTFIF